MVACKIWCHKPRFHQCQSPLGVLNSALLREGIDERCIALAANMQSLALRVFEPFLCALRLAGFRARLDHRVVAWEIWRHPVSRHGAEPALCGGAVARPRACIKQCVEASHIRLEPILACNFQQPLRSLDHPSCALLRVGLNRRGVADHVGTHAAAAHLAEELLCIFPGASCCAYIDLRIPCANAAFQPRSDGEQIICTYVRLARALARADEQSELFREFKTCLPRPLGNLNASMLDQAHESSPLVALKPFRWHRPNRSLRILNQGGPPPKLLGDVQMAKLRLRFQAQLVCIHDRCQVLAGPLLLLAGPLLHPCGCGRGACRHIRLREGREGEALGVEVVGPDAKHLPLRGLAPEGLRQPQQLADVQHPGALRPEPPHELLHDVLVLEAVQRARRVDERSAGAQGQPGALQQVEGQPGPGAQRLRVLRHVPVIQGRQMLARVPFGRTRGIHQNRVEQRRRELPKFPPVDARGGEAADASTEQVQSQLPDALGARVVGYQPAGGTGEQRRELRGLAARGRAEVQYQGVRPLRLRATARDGSGGMPRQQRRMPTVRGGFVCLAACVECGAQRLDG
mmetsp:Transcript_53086/g.152038  ORF Transcript_53086/g.152038 Transcript_53086/m.152038 type:complete len:573 (-) Transcript_53086:581-2299(-)